MRIDGKLNAFSDGYEDSLIAGVLGDEFAVRRTGSHVQHRQIHELGFAIWYDSKPVFLLEERNISAEFIQVKHQEIREVTRCAIKYDQTTTTNVAL